MVDKDKVIKAVHICYEAADCDGCPYEKQCKDSFAHDDTPHCPSMDDILTLINNTPKQVTQEIEGGGTTWWNVCSECHGAVDTSDKFCRHCGGRFISGRYKYE